MSIVASYNGSIGNWKLYYRWWYEQEWGKERFVTQEVGAYSAANTDNYTGVLSLFQRPRDTGNVERCIGRKLVVGRLVDRGPCNSEAW